MTTAIIILSGLTGAVLGTRLPVFVLIPVITLALLVVAAVGAINGDGIGSIAFDMLIVALALQFGYLIGNLTRFALAASRAPRLPSPSRQTAPTRVRSYP